MGKRVGEGSLRTQRCFPPVGATKRGKKGAWSPFSEPARKKPKPKNTWWGSIELGSLNHDNVFGRRRGGLGNALVVPRTPAENYPRKTRGMLFFTRGNSRRPTAIPAICD